MSKLLEQEKNRKLQHEQYKLLNCKKFTLKMKDIVDNQKDYNCYKDKDCVNYVSCDEFKNFVNEVNKSTSHTRICIQPPKFDLIDSVKTYIDLDKNLVTYKFE